MSSEDPPHYKTYPVREADDILGRRSGAPNLTVEDVILLLLHADPRPIRVGVDLAAQVFLAVTEVLGGLGVEPGIFRRARRGPRRDDRVRRALEELAFTGNVAVSSGGGGEISITARGLERAERQRARLPAPLLNALARKRAEWAKLEADPGTGSEAPAHGPDPPGRQAPTGAPGAGGRAGAGKVAPAGPGRREPAPPAGRPPCDSAEGCYAAGCALADRGDHGQAVRLFERALLLDPAHAGSRGRRAESLAALKGRGAGAAPTPAQPHSSEQAGPVAPGVPHAGIASTTPFPGAPARVKKRRYPRISGLPSMVGTALGPAKEGSCVDVLTQFELYRREQLSQRDGIFEQNIIHKLLSDQVYPLILRAFEEWPDPKNFVLYAVQITMHPKEELNDVRVNEDVRLRVLCRATRGGIRKGDDVFLKDIKEIVSISEVDRDPDAAAISLLQINGRWFGKFDLIYNRKTSQQKLRRALKFLSDATNEDIHLESRYDLLWSGCELLAESALLLHNILKPKSTHKNIQKGLEQLLKNHNVSYSKEYAEIAQIRESLRYGPPHPDRTREGEKKMARLLDKSLEFAFFAMNFLERRQVGIGSDDTPEARIFDPAGSPAT